LAYCWKRASGADPCDQIVGSFGDVVRGLVMLLSVRTQVDASDHPGGATVTGIDVLESSARSGSSRRSSCRSRHRFRRVICQICSAPEAITARRSPRRRHPRRRWPMGTTYLGHSSAEFSDRTGSDPWERPLCGSVHVFRSSGHRLIGRRLTRSHARTSAVLTSRLAVAV